jgi:hypothetical protein
MIPKIIINLGLFQLLNITENVILCTLIKIFLFFLGDIIFGSLLKQQPIPYIVTTIILTLIFYFSFWLLKKTSGTYWYYIIAIVTLIFF